MSRVPCIEDGEGVGQGGVSCPGQARFGNSALAVGTALDSALFSDSTTCCVLLREGASLRIPCKEPIDSKHWPMRREERERARKDACVGPALRCRRCSRAQSPAPDAP